MRALKVLMVVVVVLFAAGFGLALLLPDQVRVERSVVVQATPETAFAALNGFRRVREWSPWAALDAGTRHELEGPPAGVGARWSWHSEQPSVGSGSQEIIESEPARRVRMRLDFAGVAIPSHSSFTLAPEGEGTRITWDYETSFGGNLTARYYGLLLDRMIGGQYEQGLARFKTLVEGLPAITAPVTLVQVASRPLLFINGETPVDAVPQALAAAFARLDAYLARAGLQRVEPPLAITREFDEAQRRWLFAAAVVPNRADVTPPQGSDIRAATGYSGYALHLLHRGAHQDMDRSYEQIIAYKQAAGLRDAGPSWEQYLKDPATTPAAQLETAIYWAVE